MSAANRAGARAAKPRFGLAREFQLADLSGPVFWCFTRNTGRLDCAHAISKIKPAHLTVDFCPLTFDLRLNLRPNPS
jgi:hypothetical protein